MKTTDHSLERRQAAGLYRAIALRFYSRFVDARHQAEYYGGDLDGYGDLPKSAKVTEEYRHALSEWLNEPLHQGVAPVAAMVQLAGAIAADKFMERALGEPGPVGDDEDAKAQIQALAAVFEWLQIRLADEVIDRQPKPPGRRIGPRECRDRSGSRSPEAEQPGQRSRIRADGHRKRLPAGFRRRG